MRNVNNRTTTKPFKTNLIYFISFHFINRVKHGGNDVRSVSRGRLSGFLVCVCVRERALKNFIYVQRAIHTLLSQPPAFIICLNVLDGEPNKKRCLKCQCLRSVQSHHSFDSRAPIAMPEASKH